MSVLEWLDTPAGQIWSRSTHAPITFYVTVKDDTDEQFRAYLWYSPFEIDDDERAEWYA